MILRFKTVAVLTLLSTPSFILCSFSHICMAGHMQHGPYSLAQQVSDCWWVGCLGAVFTFSFLLKAKRKMWFLCGSAFLLLFRVQLDSLGGLGILIEVPLLVTMAVFAFKALNNLEKYINQGT